MASTSPEILSVSTSRIRSPTLMRAPSSTSHALTVPSVIDRPHLGMTIGVIAAISAGPPSSCGERHPPLRAALGM